MFEAFTDDFISTIKKAVHYFKKLTFVVDSLFFDEPILRPPRTIGEPHKAIINNKHVYFHCRSMLM